MDAQAGKAYENLCHYLNELAGLYGELYDLVHTERNALIASDLSAIEISLNQKNERIQKIKLAELARERAASDLANILGCESRLLAIADKLGGIQKAELSKHHKDLLALIEELKELNKDNEAYTQSALRTLHGAVSNIKDTLAGKSTYERKGQYKMGPEKSGNFISKEA